jgi:hypothetical protein
MAFVRRPEAALAGDGLAVYERQEVGRYRGGTVEPTVAPTAVPPDGVAARPHRHNKSPLALVYG